MKILVIRYKYIGDVLLSSTICASLRASFPNAKIDYLVYAAAAPLFEHHPAIDQIISLTTKEKQNPLRYLHRVWSVTRTKYDLVIDATSTAKTELISLFCRQAKYRIGRYKKGRGFAYTHTVNKFDGDKIDQRLAMLQPLIEDNYEIKLVSEIEISLSEQEKAIALSKLKAAGVDPTRLVFGFSVSSKLDYRMWNLNSMQQVVEACLDKYNAQIILLPGMAHERAIISQFAEKLGHRKQIFSDISVDSLRELAAVLSHCDLYVGNEGGPRHFAEAVGTSTVCVVSPSADRAEWLKSGRPNHLGIEWRDVTDFDQQPSYEFGDAVYYQLYNSIKPHHVLALIDKILGKL
jgi:heptosyltransferase-2